MDYSKLNSPPHSHELEHHQALNVYEQAHQAPTRYKISCPQKVHKVLDHIHKYLIRETHHK